MTLPPAGPRIRSVPIVLAALAAALALGPGAAIAQSPDSAATFDTTAARARARELRPLVSAGDAAALWREFSPSMRAAMKDSARFAGMTAAISGQLGPIDSVLAEEVSIEAGRTRVISLVRHANAREPMRLLMAFDVQGRLDGLAVRPAEAPKEAASAFLEYQTKTPLRLPFDGEWLVFWGGRTLAQNYHAANRAQRFAHDLVIVKDEKTHSGEGKELTDYYCYGAPLLAPGAGTIVWLEDHHPDQAIGTTNAPSPVGNGVVIDHGNGEFSVLAHMQPKSIRFKQGDKVRAGQVIGRCGNSGNTSEPHLHYHLQNAAVMREADGLPAFFHEFVADDKPVARGEIVRFQRVRPAKAGGSVSR